MSDPAVNAGKYVFVSYASDDRPTAERIVAALTKLGWRVWWDREIPAGKRYDDEIAQRLARASAVVVLWSRRSIASEWVLEEASAAKRQNLLIPAIIDGVELPLGFTLRHAVDLTSWDGSPNATELLALAAAVTDRAGRANSDASESSGPDSPVSDQHPGIRWRESQALWAVGLLTAAVALSSLWYWDGYYRTHVEHFAHVIKRNGLPEGVERLPASTLAQRSVSLALVRHGRRNPVDEVRLVNSSGNTPPQLTYIPPTSFVELNPLSSSPIDEDNLLGVESLTVARVTFTRDTSGRILEQTGLSAGGRAVYTLHYGAPEIGEYKRNGFATPIRESGIVYLRFTRLSEGPLAGLDEKVEYLDAAQRRQQDESGEYGYRVVLDERGLVSERFSLGADLEDKANNYGVLRSTYVRGQMGDVVEFSNLDRNGESVASGIGSAVLRMQYDTVGNVLRSTFHDRSGAPVTVPALGAAGFSRTYDAQGRLTEQTLFGPSQRPVMGRSGFAKQTVEWLSHTRARIRHYGPLDRPLMAFGGAFEAVQTWDALGMVVETTYLDSNGEPTRISNGCSTMAMAYDAVGNRSELRCLDEQRSPTISVDGFSIARIESDERGNPVMTRYFDRAGKPGLQGESCVAIRTEYTASGLVAKVTCLDSTGSPRRQREGWAAAVSTYDARGNMVRESYVDEQGQLTRVVAGHAAYASDFDDKNREIRTSFLGLDGRPINTDRNFAIVENELDARGFIVGRFYKDASGQLAKSIFGYARTRLKRNERGQEVEVAYYDEHLRPVVSARPGGVSRRSMYDLSGRLLERSDLDATGRPMTNAYGYAVMRFFYDEHGRETGREMRDANGRVLTFKLGVDWIDKGSVADESGFRVGDVLLTYDGEAVTTSYDFTNRLELFKGDRPREVTVEREGRIVALDLPAGRMAGLTLQERAHP